MNIIQSVIAYAKRVAGGFKKHNPTAYAFLEAFTKYFEDKVTDQLTEAVKTSIAAGTSTSGDWSDKLKAAYDATVAKLGQDAKTYDTTTIINAIQAAYTAATKTSA